MYFCIYELRWDSLTYGNHAIASRPIDVEKWLSDRILNWDWERGLWFDEDDDDEEEDEDGWRRDEYVDAIELPIYVWCHETKHKGKHVFMCMFTNIYVYIYNVVPVWCMWCRYIPTVIYLLRLVWKYLLIELQWELKLLWISWISCCFNRFDKYKKYDIPINTLNTDKNINKTQHLFFLHVFASVDNFDDDDEWQCESFLMIWSFDKNELIKDFFSSWI